MKLNIYYPAFEFRYALLFFFVILFTYQVAAQTVISPVGSSWKYLDNGSDQGTAWRVISFNDTGWKTGNGKFGYGISDATTRIEFGPNPKKKYITTYFRRIIAIPNVSAYASFTAGVKRDDGVVVYVNGVEVYRNNMPTGTITYTTLATDAKDNGNIVQGFTIPASAFSNGDNLIAVEIHQARTNTPDMAFDMEISGSSAPPPTEQYTLSLTNIGNGTVSRNPDQSTYAAGSTVTLTATPASGYQFAGWSGDASGTANPLAVNMNSNKNITATFTAIQVQYSLTVSTSGSGTVTKDPDQDTYASGSTVRLTATPASQYQFSGWSGDASGNTNPLTVTIDRNKAITATFTAVQDQTPPTVLSINRQDPATEVTSSTTVTFRTTFSEQVMGVDAKDFTATTVSGTVKGTVATVVAVGTTGTTYDVTVGSITGTGTLRLDLKSSGTGITDATGNAISGGYTSGQTYTIEQSSTPTSGLPVNFGSFWKYLDDGSNQSTAWRATSFSDATWKSGYAEFGYGNGDENTIVSYGPNVKDKYITTYFRKSISITDATAYTYYTANIKRDDGAVVYINGAEVFRTNMPSAGTISYTTLASSSSDAIVSFNINAAAFNSGTNVIAVEIHQSKANDPDISFDMELLGKTDPPPVEHPKILYYEGFESGTAFAGMHIQSSTSYGLTVVSNPTYSGTKVGRWELRAGDPPAAGGTRVEVLFSEALALQETWHSYAGYFPSADYMIDRDNETFNQWHQGSSFGTPMLTFRTTNGRYEVRRRSADGSFSTYYDLGPIIYDQWVEFVINLKQHLTNGAMQIWINGELRLNIQGATMFDGPYGRWKMGIYKSDWNNGGTTDATKRVWYVDEVKIGNAVSTYTSMKPSGDNIKVLSVQAKNNEGLLRDSQRIDVQQTDLLEIYPTLARRGSVININTNSTETADAFVTDVTGRTITSSRFTGSTSLATNNLPNGLYFINLNTKKQLKQIKFIITD